MQLTSRACGRRHASPRSTWRPHASGPLPPSMRCPPAPTPQECGAGVVQGALEGYNGTILCYGQTGAGRVAWGSACTVTTRMLRAPGDTWRHSACRGGARTGAWTAAFSDSATHPPAGAGKTFTMTGDRSCYQRRGLIPRTVSALLAALRGDPGIVSWRLRVTYLEVGSTRASERSPCCAARMSAHSSSAKLRTAAGRMANVWSPAAPEKS